MPKRPRRAAPERFRRVLSPGDPLRWLADEFQKHPDDVHVCDLGDGPIIIVPRESPGIIEELRQRAIEADGYGPN